MSLTDALIEKLIAYYQSKGINVQGLVSNPEFSNLPVDEKVRVLSKYKNELEAVPRFNYKPMLIGAGAGGLSGVAGLGVAAAKAGTLANHTGVGGFAMFGGIGAAIGAAMAGAKELSSYNNSMTIRNHIHGNRYLDAIAQNSIYKAPPPAPGIKPLSYINDSATALVNAQVRELQGN